MDGRLGKLLRARLKARLEARALLEKPLQVRGKPLHARGKPLQARVKAVIGQRGARGEPWKAGKEAAKEAVTGQRED